MRSSELFQLDQVVVDLVAHLEDVVHFRLLLELEPVYIADDLVVEQVQVQQPDQVIDHVLEQVHQRGREVFFLHLEVLEVGDEDVDRVEPGVVGGQS